MRKIKVEFASGERIFSTVTATILEDKYPELANDIWEFLATPQKAYAHHTLSTGGLVLCRPIPPYHAVVAGNQSAPIGEVPMLCDMVCGEMYWNGWFLSMVYDTCTEPLPAFGPIMVKVDEQYLDEFKRAGIESWNHVYLYHTLSTVTFSRLED